MRSGRILQLFYKTKKRYVWHTRHGGYWKRRNTRNTNDIQKQYVLQNKEDPRKRLFCRTAKIKMANYRYRLV